MQPREIRVVEHDPGWAELFRAEQEVLAGALGADARRIEHIGSTSVAGLKAKPTVDLLVIARRGADIPELNPVMESLGYECRGEGLDAEVPGTPGRYYFVKRDGAVHLVHTHVCREGHAQIADLLALRDYLRGCAEACAEYGRVKARLADEFRFDNVGYMRGKDATVKRLLADAHAWQGRKTG